MAISDFQDALAKRTGYAGWRESLARQGTGTLSVDWITSITSLMELEADWLEIQSDSGHPIYFQSFSWAKTWSNYFADGPDAPYQLAIATIRDDHELVGILPLALKKSSLGNILVGLGEPIAQYDDILVRHGWNPHVVLDAFWRSLKQRVDIDGLMLRRIRQTSPLYTYRYLQPWAAERTEVPILDLNGYISSGADFLAEASSGLRKEVRRKEKKLAELGTIKQSFFRGGPEAQLLTRKALSWKQDWLLANNMTSRMFMDQNALNMLIEYTGRTNSNTLVSALYKDDTPIAIELSFACNKHLGSFLGAYDPAFSTNGAGLVQMQRTIQWSIENSFSLYDLLPPDASYKRRVSNQTVDIVDFACPLSERGWLTFYWWNRLLKPRLKQTFYRLPESWRYRLVNALNAG